MTAILVQIISDSFRRVQLRTVNSVSDKSGSASFHFFKNINIKKGTIEDYGVIKVSKRSKISDTKNLKNIAIHAKNSYENSKFTLAITDSS